MTRAPGSVQYLVVGRVASVRGGSGLLFVVGALLTVLALWATPAGARQAGPTRSGQPTTEPCLGDQTIGVGQLPSCVYDANGNLISRSTDSSGGVGGGGTPNIAPFLILIVIWSVVPFAIAASVARSRGEPVGTAVLLTLVLGWIGLVIVLYGQRRVAGDVGRLMGTPAPPGTARASQPPARSQSPAERLRAIDELHAQGLITDEEHDRRRRAIVDSL